MSGDDSVADTDALKVLNTEIMAGTGPDVPGLCAPGR